MTAAKGQGWTILLADLALILFLVTASAAMPRDGAVAPDRAGVMQGVYDAVPGAPSLSDWIDSQAMGDGGNLTIEARYDEGDLANAMARAARLAREARDKGKNATIVLMPGEPDLTARLSYDARLADEMAR